MKDPFAHFRENNCTENPQQSQFGEKENLEFKAGSLRLHTVKDIQSRGPQGKEPPFSEYHSGKSNYESNTNSSKTVSVAKVYVKSQTQPCTTAVKVQERPK